MIGWYFVNAILAKEMYKNACVAKTVHLHVTLSLN